MLTVPADYIDVKLRDLSLTLSVPCVVIHLLQFEPTNARGLIKIIITMGQ